MATTRFQIAKRDIIEHFDSLPQSVFSGHDLGGILSQRRNDWRLAQSMATAKFVAEMAKRAPLKRAVIKLYNGRELERFIWREASVYEIALSLRPRSYLCHYTALVLHELTEQVPKTIYTNFEQPPKPDRPVRLTQEAIDSAFAKPMRITNNVTTYMGLRLCLLESRHTSHAGVVDFAAEGSKTRLRMTDLERTLIDCAVRPLYAGGVEEVLKAFETARERLSVNRLGALLRKLAFTYPYHQAIGFFLERAGYPESSLRLMEKFEKRFDFYLTYEMKERAYSKRWRLWFPKGME